MDNIGNVEKKFPMARNRGTCMFHDTHAASCRLCTAYPFIGLRVCGSVNVRPPNLGYVACSWRQINNPIRRATREALPGEDTHRVRWQSLGPQFHGHTHLVTMSVLAHRQSLLNWCTNQPTRHICRSQRVTATSAHGLLGHLCPIRTSYLLRFVSHQHSDVC